MGCRLSIVDLSFDFLVSLVPHLCASSSVGAMGAKAPLKDKDYTTWIARIPRLARSRGIAFCGWNVPTLVVLYITLRGVSSVSLSHAFSGYILNVAWERFRVSSRST